MRECLIARRKAAETALSGTGREAPPFARMCAFLALRALGDGAAAPLLEEHAKARSEAIVTAGFLYRRVLAPTLRSNAE